MPTRVIHIVDHGEAGIRLRLLETDGLTAPYVALSYCWGGDQRLKTTRATLGQFEESLPAFATLPATIQDAVTVTHELGLLYLFVDAFCIVQDDEQDMQQQIAQMPQIYGEALVTLLASRAASVDDGFLQRRPSSLPNTDAERCEVACRLPMRCADGNMDSVVLLQLTSAGNATDPIHTRAWTMQEQLLANRTLAYSHNHTSWGCWSADTPSDGWIKTGADDEPIQTWDPAVFRAPSSSAATGKLDAETLRYGWRQLVTKYTYRSLSFPGDKLPAIAAAAARVGEALHQDDYVAGLWKSSLIYDLCWKTSPMTRCARPRDFRAPSWSWAAVDGEIDYYAPQSEDLGSATAEVLDCRAEPMSPTVPYGAVKSGHLVVRGRLRHVVLRLEAVDRNFFRVSELDRGGGFESMLPVFFDAIEPEFENNAGGCMDMAIMELHDDRSREPPVCLVLRDLGHQTFSRLGISFRPSMVRFQIGGTLDDGQALATSHLEWTKRFEECVPTTITIV